MPPDRCPEASRVRGYEPRPRAPPLLPFQQRPAGTPLGGKGKRNICLAMYRCQERLKCDGEIVGIKIMDGIYAITFRGAADWGTGMLVLKNGTVVGADVSGVLYDGTYSVLGENVVVKFIMTVPPGAALVQGVPARPESYKIPVDTVVPISSFENNNPVLLKLPPGPVNVIFKRLRAL